MTAAERRRAMADASRRRRARRGRRLRRKLKPIWKVEGSGNYHLVNAGEDYRVIVFIHLGRFGGHYQTRVMYVPTREKWFSRHYTAPEPAQVAALDLLVEVQEEVRGYWAAKAQREEERRWQTAAAIASPG
jgi:hypothetical protein